jgi:hypothetical protein
MRIGSRAPKFEISEGLQAGFSGLWPLHSEYAIKNGVVFGTGLSGRYYSAPLHRQEVFTGLRSIARTGGRKRSEEEILHFVYRFGLLGRSYLLRSKVAVRGEKDGEPLDWIVAHARTTQAVLDLTGVMNEKLTWEQRGERIETVLQGRFAIGANIVRVRDPRSWRRDDWSGPRGAACQFIARILNENLEDVRRRFSILQGCKGVRATFNCWTPIQAAYWRLGDVVEGGLQLKRCEAPDCRAYFVQTHMRQRFCPVVGAPGKKTEESPCATRTRQQAWRIK